MGRGKHESTKNRKEAKRLISIAEAEKIAAMEVHAKYIREHPQDWLMLRLEKLIDRIDPLETGAIFGATFLIHKVIMGSQDWINQIQEGGIDLTSFPYNIIPSLIKKAGGANEELPKLDVGGDMVIWIVSFTLAFFLIRHGSEILSSMTKLTSWVGGFFAAA